MNPFLSHFPLPKKKKERKKREKTKRKEKEEKKKASLGPISFSPFHKKNERKEEKRWKKNGKNCTCSQGCGKQKDLAYRKIDKV